MQANAAQPNGTTGRIAKYTVMHPTDIVPSDASYSHYTDIS